MLVLSVNQNLSAQDGRAFQALSREASRWQDRDFRRSHLQRNSVAFAMDWQVRQFDGLVVAGSQLGNAVVADIDNRLDPNQTHQSAPGVVAIAADTSVDAEEVLAAISIRQPVVHEKMDVFLRESSLQFRRRIALHTLKHQIIHRTPDGPMPVRLPQKQGILTGDGRQDPFTPELSRIGHRGEHLLRAVCIRRSTDQRIEICRRQASEKIAGSAILLVAKPAAIHPQTDLC